MSKRVFHHPPEPANGRKYWRSLGQLSDTPEFRGWLEREFPQGAAELQGGEVTRRSFLQLMGASTALAGLSLSACRRPEKHLVPFTKGNEWSIPGKALFYSTSMPGRQGFAPLAVTTYDGRPTKIEGNPFHPAVKGSSDTFAQTSILDLYDPERAQHFLKKDGDKFVESDEAAFDKALQEILTRPAPAAGSTPPGGQVAGNGIAFLVERCPSPTRERLRTVIEKKFPNVSWCIYEASAPLRGVVEGLSVVPQLDKADVILAVDCDFLGCSDGTTELSRQFSARRKVEDATSKMNRLYAVENRYTVTGGMADHRLRLQASRFGAFLVTLASHIGSVTGDANLGTVVKNVGAIKWPETTALWIKETANDLIASKGRSLVLVGERQPEAMRHLAHAINSALGNLGETLIARPEVERPGKSISELALDIDAGKVQTLFILGGNPVFNAPGDLEWVTKQAKVPNVIRLGCAVDETTVDSAGTARVSWQVPKAHYLEHWGDGIATDGSYVSVQPMILPLYGGWSELDLLARIAGLPKPQGPELVQETFRGYVGGADQAALTVAWTKFLHDGYLEKSAPAPAPLKYDAEASGTALKRLMVPSESTDETFEIVFVPDSKLDDGRHANNGWLQELPDPITKLTWDNAALISPKSAKALGIEPPNGKMEVEMIEISFEGKKSIEIAALIAPGHADNSITIPLGYGRTVVGRVGAGTGVDVFPLTTASAAPFLRLGARVSKVGRMFPLAITQEHGALEGRGGDIVRESNFDQYQKTVSVPVESEEGQHYQKMGMDAHAPKNVSLYSNPVLSDPWQWGMTVDLNLCTGCSSCMVACQAENNIPIVGKKQVIGNREMHWIRTDRYFATDGGGNIDDPEMVSQPMLCQHCENAPCETVCPVNATVHSEDGLNVMAYNRCIGTRYCANNCPFKVRRFNFFDYNQRDVLGDQPANPLGGKGLYAWNLISPKGTPETIKMQKNPNVTVRMRGVMEKCTFCVQRIQEAKIAAKVHAKDSSDVKIPENSFTVACAQACASDAIVFGDINNPKSRVSQILKRQKETKKSQEHRSYRLLEYLNVNARVWYLARVRNPNNKMPDATRQGQYIPAHHGAAHGSTESHSGGAH